MPQNKLLEEFKAVRKRTVEISLPLTTEELSMQPTVFASPLKWHLAHTTWFFEAFILIDFFKDYTCVDEKFLFLFNSYYHQKGEKLVRHSRGFIGRPDINEVLNYRELINQKIEDHWGKIETLQLTSLIKLGLEHEKQHQELMLYDLQYLLFQNPIKPTYNSEFNCLQRHIESYKKPIQFSEQIHPIGTSSNDDFHYDNEGPEHNNLIHSFSIESNLVTNQDFIDFIESGGYSNPLLWLDEAWSLINSQNIQHPYYWNQSKDQSFSSFTLNGNLPITPQAPVQSVSFYEADAIARFLGKRLPTEFELEVAADQLDNGLLWEWSQSAYLPYPGFQIADGAIGEYNGKFMVNQKVLKGGSYASPTNHIRKTYRNFFHPNLFWMYSGVRLCKL